MTSAKTIQPLADDNGYCMTCGDELDKADHAPCVSKQKRAVKRLHDMEMKKEEAQRWACDYTSDILPDYKPVGATRVRVQVGRYCSDDLPSTHRVCLTWYSGHEVIKSTCSDWVHDEIIDLLTTQKRFDDHFRPIEKWPAEYTTTLVNAYEFKAKPSGATQVRVDIGRPCKESKPPQHYVQLIWYVGTEEKLRESMYLYHDDVAAMLKAHKQPVHSHFT